MEFAFEHRLSPSEKLLKKYANSAFCKTLNKIPDFNDLHCLIGITKEAYEMMIKNISKIKNQFIFFFKTKEELKGELNVNGENKSYSFGYSIVEENSSILPAFKIDVCVTIFNTGSIHFGYWKNSSKHYFGRYNNRKYFVSINTLELKF